jgi:hypothetical protein
VLDPAIALAGAKRKPQDASIESCVSRFTFYNRSCCLPARDDIGHISMYNESAFASETYLYYYS